MRCPICDKPTERAFRPFCSKRCADIDLGRWMTESYRIPAEEEGLSSDAPEPPADPKKH
ncbi:DNA gyrase inhibitor YacG [Halovulum dunhuangense]|uniref:DNA gyrase inhibitor YacG n=1 Tax=Halovulum dunhuangense TaxID=1505036 RepID=A0A849L4D7_9RHOB|nr:DNA gyrase inhibitor YacG [Halovulum dunhuangense]NNU81064.1 DNA gyrase inhibitor YacG [Halovulum dunhuangense]